MKRLCIPGAGGAFLLVMPTILQAQTLGQGSDDGISVWRVVGSLIFCLLLGFGALLGIRKWGGQLPTFSLADRKIRRLSLNETLRVNAQTQLCLVTCDGKEMLLAVSPQGVHVINPPAVETGGVLADQTPTGGRS